MSESTSDRTASAAATADPAADTTVALRAPWEGCTFADVPDIATLSDGGNCSRFALRGYDLAAQGLDATLGVRPPLEINRAVTSGTRTVMKLGPDEWLILAEADAALQLDLPPGVKLAMVDVSHRQAALQIAGPLVEAVLNAGCPLQLDLVAFPVGRATRTLFAKAEIVLWRTATAAFHIEVARSFVAYLIAHLNLAIEVEAALAKQGRG